jgi:hypothetical protein
VLVHQLLYAGECGRDLFGQLWILSLHVIHVLRKNLEDRLELTRLEYPNCDNFRPICSGHELDASVAAARNEQIGESFSPNELQEDR